MLSFLLFLVYLGLPPSLMSTFVSLQHIVTWPPYHIPVDTISHNTNLFIASYNSTLELDISLNMAHQSHFQHSNS